MRPEFSISPANYDAPDRLSEVGRSPPLDEFFMPIDRISIPI
jgi:hypothetical protein